MASGIKVTRVRKVITVALVLTALLVLAVAVAIWLLVDTDQIRQRLETRFSESLGMDVQIGKPLQLDLLQGPGVTIADLKVSHQGQAVASAESVSVTFATAPLLTGNLHPLDLHIRQPQLTLERDSSGELNLYWPEPGSPESSRYNDCR